MVSDMLGAETLEYDDALRQEAENVLREDPYSGHLFVFRGRRGDLIKIVWWDGQGACLFSKRLEKGRFVWPSPAAQKVCVTAAELAMLLEGIDWRAPQRSWTPLTTGAAVSRQKQISGERRDSV